MADTCIYVDIIKGNFSLLKAFVCLSLETPGNNMNSVSLGEYMHFQGMQLCKFHFCLPFQFGSHLKEKNAPRRRSDSYTLQGRDIEPGLCRPPAGKLSLSTHQKWVPFPNWERIRQLKEMCRFRLSSTVPKIQSHWAFGAKMTSYQR